RAVRRDLEHGALRMSAAGAGGTVEVAIAALDQRALRLTAVAAAGEDVQDGFRAARRDLEHRAVVCAAAAGGRAVIVAVAARDEAGRRITAVAAVVGEGVQYLLRSARRNLKDYAVREAATPGGSVEIAAAIFHECTYWIAAVATFGERVQQRFGVAGVDLERRSEVGAAAEGSPLKKYRMLVFF